MSLRADFHPQDGDRPSWASRQRQRGRALGQQVRRHWYLVAPLCVIWGLAYVRVFVDPTPRLPLLFNVTRSLPYTIAVVQYGDAVLRRGDFVVFSFSGPAQQDYPGLRNQPFFKIVQGVPGDRITVVERHVYVNGVLMGVAKTHTFDKRPLEPIASMVIPAGHVYVQGTHADSFDSRYRASGLVRADRIVGKVKPLF